MSIVFFNSPIGTPKVKFTNTDMTVAELKAEGIIPSSAATLVLPTPTTEEGLAQLTHVDKLTFDDMEAPTKVVFDMDLVDMFWKDTYRRCRTELLTKLDMWQQRALVKGLTSVVADIESDKDALRDLPNNVDYTTYTSFMATCEHDPTELFVDYDTKYSAAVA